jgi:hypothetical protein
MPLAHEVATELRKFADSLDKTPDAEIVRPRVFFAHTYVSNPKDRFLALASLLPRPLKKGDGYTKDVLDLTHETPNITIKAYIDKSETCELVEPAKPAVYRCVPILSLDEEDSLDTQEVL